MTRTICKVSGCREKLDLIAGLSTFKRGHSCDPLPSIGAPAISGNAAGRNRIRPSGPSVVSWPPKAPFAAILGKPIVSVNISGELQAAQRAIAGRGNPVEIFGCGKNEIEQQLTGIFSSLPQYRGWPVVVQFAGMRSVPEGQCQALQNQLVHSS